MSHHLIPTADLTKLKEAYEEIEHVYKVAGWDMKKSVTVTEALALLDALQPVEVVEVEHRNSSGPIYAVETYYAVIGSKA